MDATVGLKLTFVVNLIKKIDFYQVPKSIVVSSWCLLMSSIVPFLIFAAFLLGKENEEGKSTKNSIEQS